MNSNRNEKIYKSAKNREIYTMMIINESKLQCITTLQDVTALSVVSNVFLCFDTFSITVLIICGGKLAWFESFFHRHLRFQHHTLIWTTFMINSRIIMLWNMISRGTSQYQIRTITRTITTRWHMSDTTMTLE